jgi:hypothetical protein
VRDAVEASRRGGLVRVGKWDAVEASRRAGLVRGGPVVHFEMGGALSWVSRFSFYYRQIWVPLYCWYRHDDTQPPKIYISQTKSSLDKIFYKVMYHHIIYICDFFGEFRRHFYHGLHGFSRRVWFPPDTLSRTYVY